MKNYLVAIDNEIKSYYDSFVKDDDIDTFTDNCIATLDYYTNPIFLNGKNTIRKKLALIKDNNINEQEKEFLLFYKDNKLNKFKILLSNAIKSCYEDRTTDKDFYDQLIEVIIGYCIKLFKYSQLSEYKNNDVKNVVVITDNKLSCNHCKTLSKFPQSIELLMDNIDDLHPYCVFTFDPDKVISIKDKILINNIQCINIPSHLIERIKSITTKLKISLPSLISTKTFEFVDDISQDDRFLNTLREKYDSEKVSILQDKLSCKVNIFILSDRVLISNGHLSDIEYVIIKCLLMDKLNDFDMTWWETNYDEKQLSKYIKEDISIYTDGFVNYVAEENFKNYFIESAVYYVYNPSLLRDIDIKAYDKLTIDVFNNIKFLKE